MPFYRRLFAGAHPLIFAIDKPGNRHGNVRGDNAMQAKTPQDVGLQPMPENTSIISVWGNEGKNYCLGRDNRVYCWSSRFSQWLLDAKPLVNT